ncbi:helix-turn-helix domain-containing protein [Oleidesulfovibrio sp.]|uniref:helix-turn-helix domain-containing protein n=1 Tax=Oleidesulfovibrio sp. TaxID=2909707 RepID=UPI003A8B891D
MSFPQNLRALRGAQSRKDFAALLGIQPNTLRNYEEGLSLPNFELGMLISRKFNVSPEWLLSGENAATCESSTHTTETESRGTATAACSRCIHLELELEKLRQEERKEREILTQHARELTQELREVNAENRRLASLNGELRERIGRLEDQRGARASSKIPSTSGNVA